MSIPAIVAKILLVGHSLVDPELPPLLEAAFFAQGHKVAVQAQIINGAPLHVQWENSAKAEGVDARAALSAGQADVLVLTEAIPLAVHIANSDSAAQVAAFAGLAWETKPDTRVYIYETWHSLASLPGTTTADDPGAGMPWRERLITDLPLWEGLAAKANALRPADAAPIRLIPAGQAMGLIADAASAGEIPGIGGIRDLFTNDLHPNGKGLYLVTMVHLAAITGQSPEGLPAKLTRRWASRDAVLTDAQTAALQRIAWQPVKAQAARESVADALPEAQPATDQATKTDLVVVPSSAPPGSAPAGFAPITNRALALGLAAVNDWSVQQPFLDVMKTARPWTGHFPGQWGGMDHAALAAGGWLDDNGWPKALPPQITAVSTLILTDLPVDAAGVSGRYELRYVGKGELRLEGRAQDIQPIPGGLSFAYTPGEGAVIATLGDLDAEDPLREISVVRQDRAAVVAAGEIFNPDWLARIRGVKSIRFMDWMATNNSSLSDAADRPKPDDYTWARNGVPIEIMIALANELQADPWFTMPHLANDELVRFYAQAAFDQLDPALRAQIEYSNEVWNSQFTQGIWVSERARARWADESAGVQYYAMRAAEVGSIWAQVFGDEAPTRLTRIVATQTGVLGIESAILNAPLVAAEGHAAPVASFDAYAVTGYFAALLGSEVKAEMLRGWLSDSKIAAEHSADIQGLVGATRSAFVEAHRFDQALALAAQELADGSLSGVTEDTLSDVLGRVLPYQAAVAKTYGLRLMMYEGGSHVVGYGPLVEDAELADFFQTLNYSAEMGALYQRLMAGWAGLTDAPFNAFVDVYRPNKWGSWGGLRHLGDDNPRWRALTRGCAAC